MSRRPTVEVHEQVELSETVTVHTPRGVLLPAILAATKRVKAGWRIAQVDITFKRWVDVRVPMK
jgi:hypothetical protein